MKIEKFREFVPKYCKKVHDEYDINVPLDRVKFVSSSKLGTGKQKITFGRAEQLFGEGGYDYVMKFSEKQYTDPDGKRYGDIEELKNCIRHEWAHVIQYEYIGGGSHGTTFQWLADQLDVDRDGYENSQDIKYLMKCDRGHSTTFSRRSKNVKVVQRRNKSDKMNDATCQNCKNAGIESRMSVERVYIPEAMERLRQEAFGEVEDESWKETALVNIQTAKANRE